MSHTTLQDLIDSGVKLTPMMEQYYSIKKNYEDTFLLFRMGDFYEVFFEDAQRAAKLLNITLTHRGKLGDTPIPMAGMPHHAAATYIDRLTAMGLKVAICEQVQDPKDAKGIVKRAVTQVVSPGMPFDLDKTDKEQRFMASAYQADGHYYLVVIDFTTGDFKGHKLKEKEEFLEKLRSYSPRELITFMNQWEEIEEVETLCKSMGTLTTFLSEEYFETKYTDLYLEKIIPSYKRDAILKKEKTILNPIGALAYYICSTQNLEEFFHIKPFQLINEEGNLKITLPTLTGLEIFPKNREQYRESLLGFLDRTQCALGSRQLRKMFLNPLRSKEEILKRQELVEKLQEQFDLLKEIRGQFSDIRDLERILAKISTGKATASDLINTAQAIGTFKEIDKKTGKLTKGLIKSLTKKEWKVLNDLEETIVKTINDEIGASLEKGNLIRPGCHKKRDKLAKLNTNAHEELKKLEDKYREETGIPKLKVKSNNVAGYFIEVSKSFTNKVPKHFDRRQTLVNSERYMTEELAEFEKEMLSAKEKLEKLEREIFKSVTTQMSDASSEVQALADVIGLNDSFQSLAWVAIHEEFSKPAISDEKGVILRGAWHPLIKSSIRDQFVAHDLTLDSEIPFGLITGPNMAGKTTVMREVAIIQILTQVGSFVPAEFAQVGLCDYIFSRLGASDDILKGHSTFMVEMAETAEIVRHATEKSLIILDEVGRGTSTYDGVSIAWSLVEHLCEKTKATTLFATHYHELIELAQDLPGAKNLTVETTNQNGEVQFLYRLIETGASQSFGIHVAKLAGLPNEILNRSQEILTRLESHHQATDNSKIIKNRSEQLTFFPEEVMVEETPVYLKELEKDLDNIDIQSLTPLEAMIKLDQFKKVITENRIQ
ncbi:MAG: DNA mismatch repair protein MutS [Oligoflexia bacterium]|nr:DNA mismatch repair protein MutS [Oligoflexia bacterium]